MTVSLCQKADAMLAWMEGMDPYNTTSIVFMDFDTGEQTTVQADQGPGSGCSDLLTMT